MKLAQQLSEFV